MEPTREQLAALARQVAATVEDEIDCEAMLGRMAAYFEAGGRPADLAPELAKVRQHLEVCPQCREEFEALLRVFAE